MNNVDFSRARELVMKHGWNSTCFQIVNPGMEYWFGPDGNSVVGYVSSGDVRVVAGAPVCVFKDLQNVTEEFERTAKSENKNVCYFGAEGRLESLFRTTDDHSFVLLGAQPVWNPADWADTVSRHSSLRAQLNRARNKGVVVTEWPIEKAHNNEKLHECLRLWLRSKGLPPLHFVIEPETLDRLENRRIFVAEVNGKTVAFLVLSPVPERRGWLTEQFPHCPGAPNGSVELMMDTAIRALAHDGCEYITLGLSPLSKRAKIKPFDNPAWLGILLAWMRKHGQRFYNFEGLDRFKSKLMPARWEPVFAISNEPKFSGGTMWSIAKAFTENKPFRVFGHGVAKAIGAEIRTFRRWVTASV
jgi:phosphatidylglycerol lysyltransferase